MVPLWYRVKVKVAFVLTYHKCRPNKTKPACVQTCCQQVVQQSANATWCNTMPECNRMLTQLLQR